jgi:hypothetical protein
VKNKTKIRLEKKFKIWKHIIANKIFNDYCYDGDLEGIIEKIKKYRGVLVAMRNYELSTTDYPDYRITSKGYGYESIESINSTLDYIADRFIAEIRLIWLINLPEEYEKIS